MNAKKLSFFIRILILFAVYFCSANLGLKLGAVSKFATFIWPPTGIALASLLIFGSNLWPGIFLAAFLVNFLAGAPSSVALGISIGNTLEAFVGVYLLRSYGKFGKKIVDLNDAIRFIFFGVLLSPVVSSTIGSLSLWFGNIVSAKEFPETWFVWWYGDAMGALVVGSLLMAFFGNPVFIQTKKIRALVEGFALILTTFVLSGSIFGNGLFKSPLFHRPYFLFPILLWSALRFRVFGTTFITFLISIIGIWGTATGRGFFASGDVTQSLFHLQTFIAVMSVSGLVFASIITEWARAETGLRENLNILKGVIEGSTDAIFVKDTEGRYLLVNSATARSMGFPVQEIIGKKDIELLPGKSSEKIRSDDKRVLTQRKNIIVETEMPGGDGSVRIYSSSKSPYYDARGNIVGVIGVARDITEKKAAEEKLRAAVSARDEFLSIASHELKTPITSLKMQLQMTQMKVKPEENKAPSPQKLSQVLDISSKQVERLSTLVEDLLDVSRIQAGRLEYFFQKINLREIVDEVLEQFELQLNSSQCHLVVEVDPTINGFWDRSRIEQVLVNLISNAVKYAPGENIFVRATLEENRMVTLSVEDSGPGIPVEKQNFLFERFVRVTDSRHITGLGLGLFIVKKIIEGHQGSVYVDSVLKKGTKFVVHLPVRPGVEGIR